jgi:hypothetical protein
MTRRKHELMRVQVEPVGEFELKGIRRPLAAYNVLAAGPVMSISWGFSQIGQRCGRQPISMPRNPPACPIACPGVGTRKMLQLVS